MPVPTAFHPRTHALCKSLLYKEWAGCYAVRRYDTSHEREYFAIRHAAGLQDATPLYKYDLRGPDAGRLLTRIMVRAFLKMKVGVVRYICWCDDEGKVLDDGTVTRLDDQHFRMTSAEPTLYWLERHARGLDVEIADVSRKIAAVALQGPNSRAVLSGVFGSSVEELAFFRAMTAQADGREVVITRTGYTGDLGYELWVPNADALWLWDTLMEAGRPHGLMPTGLDTLDVVRVEAGFILQDVDYFSARAAMIPRQESSPFELGLGWMVKTERDPFIGQAALVREEERGSARALAGVEIDWEQFEDIFNAWGLPPDLPTETCRAGAPVYSDGRQIGQVTSRTWSPTLKRYIGLASVLSEFSEPGTELSVEVTVEYHRTPCRARVVKKPFFDPERKKA
ncbi:MAG: aminomethyltransferase family protein [Planctomycetota bacterium]|nr:aminomethyltransferase family protein [Planctomycetota bacterium]